MNMHQSLTIGIDGNEANVSRRVGIGQYAYQVLKHLYESQKSKVKSQKSDIRFNIFLKEKPQNDFPQANKLWAYKVFGPGSLWTQFALPLRLYLEKEKPDVFFSPTHYAPRWCHCPRVVAVMDLSYIHFPELFTKKDLYQLTRWTNYSVEHAAKILTISRYTKDDIIRTYGVSPENVIVTYPGYDANRYQVKSQNLKVKNTSQNLKVKYNITDDFILFVGTVQPRKNIVGLVEAFERTKNQEPRTKNLQLIIVGKRGWMWEETMERIERSPVRKDIIIADFVDDDELAQLYRQARCFVLPSLYEGFGIPVIEAMACGCPVVASRVSSLPEVVGDAGLLVDPHSSDELADAILEAGYDEKKRSVLIKKGLENTKRFSWESCAEKTLEVLRNI